MSVHILAENSNVVKSVKRSSVLPEQMSVSISNGNKKYKGNEKTGFIIWSITQGKTCPFATAHCRNKCYAQKAWNAYPTCRVSREENLRATFSPLFVDKMVELILYKARTGKNAKRERIIVRVHESGDFFAAWYFDKWCEIAKRVYPDYPDLDDAYDRVYRCERALYAVSDVTGIPWDVIVTATRYYIRHGDKCGWERCLWAADCERLITGLCEGR